MSVNIFHNRFKGGDCRPINTFNRHKQFTYVKVGDYYIPALTVPNKKYNIGKYGRLHREFLKKYRPSIYTTKLMDGTLLEYLEEIDAQAKDMVDRLVKDLAVKSGITEELKSTDQMKWVGLMNMFKHTAEEFVISEIVYGWEARI